MALDLRPVPVTVAPGRRLPQLFVGLALYGVSSGLLVRSALGLQPWGVLSEALSERTGLTYGTVTAAVGVLVLLCWIPLRQRPGVGTIANIVVIAVAVDALLALVGPPSSLVVRVLLLLGGVVLNAVAIALYVGARLGPGPRDGLMTGFTARSGKSLRWVRMGIEVTVLALGWVLGGTVGVGTVVYALTIGPLTQLFLPRMVWR